MRVTTGPGSAHLHRPSSSRSKVVDATEVRDKVCESADSVVLKHFGSSCGEVRKEKRWRCQTGTSTHLWLLPAHIVTFRVQSLFNRRQLHIFPCIYLSFFFFFKYCKKKSCSWLISELEPYAETLMQLDPGIGNTDVPALIFFFSKRWSAYILKLSSVSQKLQPRNLFFRGKKKNTTWMINLPSKFLPMIIHHPSLQR